MSIKVLFLCTGNSCRSQMAEAFCNDMHKNIKAYSAGIKKKGLDPMAVKIMQEENIDMSLKQYSKKLKELENVEFDFVFTVCGHADETCPVFPGDTVKIHHPFDDPPKLAKKEMFEEKKLEIYRRVRDEIKNFVGNIPKTIEERSNS